MTHRWNIVLFTLVLISAVSCDTRDRSTGKRSPAEITVDDFRGKTIAVAKPVTRVVCLIESALSGIYMLGEKDKVVGIPADVYKEPAYFYYRQLDERIRSKSLSSPGNWDFISLERIVALEPDLVIIWSSQTEAIDRLEGFGIPVYAVMLHSFQDVMKEMIDFGVLLGAEERAKTLIQYTKKELVRIRNSAERDPPRSVYFMWAQGIHETSGTNSTVNELLAYAGTENACTLEQEHVVISVEKLLDWDPDLMVLWPGNQTTPIDVLGHPQLQELIAVKESQVFVLPDPFLCDFWTLKMVFPVSRIASWAYPGSFAGSMEAQKMLELLYDQKLNLYDPEE
jgi:iron complex transport system substrate-binding protein